MTLLSRVVLFLTLAVAASMLVIFILKAVLAVALIVAAVVAGISLFNFARALSRRLALPLGERTPLAKTRR